MAFQFNKGTNNRRSFFTSTLVIKPPPAPAIDNGPPSHQILAALSSPKNGKSKTTIKVTSSMQQARMAQFSSIKKGQDVGSDTNAPSPGPSTIQVSATRQQIGPDQSSSPSNGIKKSQLKRFVKGTSSSQITTKASSTAQQSEPDLSSSSSAGIKKAKEKGEKKASSSQTTSKQTAVGKTDPPVQTDRAAKARATRLVKLANARAEREAAVANPPETTPVRDEPRRTLRETISSANKPSFSYAPPTHRSKAQADDLAELSSPPHIILKIPKRQVEKEKQTTPLKSFQESGMYCQDDHAKSPYKLISRVLFRREAEEKAKQRQKIHPDIQVQIINRPTFPPLPYDHGYKLFFDEVHDFVLPFDIRREAENGVLDGKKKPAPYSKLKANKFPERQRMMADLHAVCGCKPESDCGEKCINRMMNYLCGKDCPCGERCTNISLAKRRGASVKVSYTGSRGFGLTAVEDVKEGDFVIDYRGEVISMDTYQERCQKDYAVSKNFYALAYDHEEVIDAGARGNEARFINHSCNPNMIVHRYQNLGDGQVEYEVGMWALRDIAAGEELTYDYNFDAFGIAEGGARVECRCEAPNCVGFLGRKDGEKSAKQIALDIAAKEAAMAKVARIKAKRASGNSKIKEKSSEKAVSRKGKEKESNNLLLEIAKAPFSSINHLPTPDSMDSGVFDIPPPVDFYKSPSTSNTATMAKKKSRQSLPNLSRPVGSAFRSPAKTPRAYSSRLEESSPDDGPTRPQPAFTNNVRKYERRAYGVDPPKPASGWTSWLHKTAAKVPRTEEDWQKLRLEKRKGEAYVDDLIAEYGRLPSKGVPGQIGKAVSQQLLDEKRRDLERKGIDYTAAGPRGWTRVVTEKTPGSRYKKRKRVSEPARKKTSARTDMGSDSDDSGEDEAEMRRRAKKEAIRKRNGAPMGWVYEPITEPPAQAVDAVPEVLAPRKRRAMSYAE